jgi:hypothetical protein
MFAGIEELVKERNGGRLIPVSQRVYELEDAF